MQSLIVSCRAHRAAVVSSLLTASVVAPVLLGSHAQAALPDYQLVGTFSLPANAASYDILPDGRAIAIVGESIWTQSTPNISAFSLAGSIPAGTVASFGASFLRANPAGTRIAIGDNDFGPGAGVFVFDTASLSTSVPATGSTYPIHNYDAHWSDNNTLFVSGGSFTDTLITRLDASAGTHATVITGIAGASAGVTTDGAHLYTGNGFSFGSGSATGDIKAFPVASLTGAPLHFETAGTLVASALSANTLGFDAFGNLLVGGGPGGFAAVIDGAEVQTALIAGPIATTHLKLSPTTQDSHFIRHNPATGELLITTFGDSTVYRYGVVPAPASALLLTLGLLTRSRRRA